MILQIINLTEQFPLLSWIGSDPQIQKIYRHLTLSLLRDARDLVELGDPDTAADLLNILLLKVTGQQGSWLQNNPNSGLDAQTLLYENVATILNLLQPESPIPVYPPAPAAPGT